MVTARRPVLVRLSLIKRVIRAHDEFDLRTWWRWSMKRREPVRKTG